MIEINLIPEHLRKKRRSVAEPRIVTGLPKEATIGIIGGFLGILVLFSLLLQIYLGVKIAQRNHLKKKMEELGAAKVNVEKVIQDIKTTQARLKTLEQVTGGRTIFWAPKLNEISDNIPRGIWLTKVSLEGRALVIEGSSVSKTKSEITDIHSFANNLKNSKMFMENCANIEVGMIKARGADTLSIADFTLRADLAK